jgi:hypothetical protein
VARRDQKPRASQVRSAGRFGPPIDAVTQRVWLLLRRPERGCFSWRDHPAKRPGTLPADRARKGEMAAGSERDWQSPSTLLNLGRRDKARPPHCKAKRNLSFISSFRFDSCLPLPSFIKGPVNHPSPNTIIFKSVFTYKMHAFSIAALVLFSAAVAAPASGFVVPRKATPSSYASSDLEPYQTYHSRYLAVGCNHKHHSSFFNACCHPMLANETLATARPSYCAPSSSASASASAAESTTTSTTDDDDEDCDDGDDESTSDSFSSTFSPATSATEAETTSSSVPTTSEFTPAPSSTEEAAPTSTEAAPTTSTEQPAPTTSSSEQAAPTTGSTDAASQTFTGGHATFFYQNGVAGACGTVHSDSDKIVALDQSKYGDSGNASPYCGKTVSITGLGKTMTATVADDCPTCDNANSLDMSVGLFTEFASEDVGEFDITWSFV